MPKEQLERLELLWSRLRFNPLERIAWIQKHASLAHLDFVVRVWMKAAKCVSDRDSFIAHTLETLEKTKPDPKE